MRSKWLAWGIFSLIAAALAVLWFTNRISGPAKPSAGEVWLDQLDVKTRDPQPAGKNQSL
jgi:hypothetical protein